MKTRLRIVKPWHGDEKYVGDEPLLNPPPAPRTPPALETPTEPSPDDAFGPFATEITKRPYVCVYYGSADFKTLTAGQAKVYGLVRSWNECGKECRMAADNIGMACGISYRHTLRVVDQLTKLGLLRKNPHGPRPGKPMILEARRNV